jgi:hypothetical protein
MGKLGQKVQGRGGTPFGRAYKEGGSKMGLHTRAQVGQVLAPSSTKIQMQFTIFPAQVAQVYKPSTLPAQVAQVLTR